ncbi:glycosyltransferase, partial [Xanthomonas citri pv. citri]|nr:glycosyltransferase [Xanthomonas citri pv. citri]
AHLVVIGEGPREIMADIRTRSDVTVLGSMPRSRLMALVSEADVSALPSLGEGFPLTQIEAMSVGTPVIVSTATFGHDVVTE